MKQLVLNNVNRISNINDIKNLLPKGYNVRQLVNYATLEAPAPPDWVKKYIVDFVASQKDIVSKWVYTGVINACEIGCAVCIIVCGLSILWFVIDQNGSTPRKYISGSFIFYMGIRLFQYIIA